MAEPLVLLNYVVVAVVFALLLGAGVSQRARVGLCWLAIPALMACVATKLLHTYDTVDELTFYASYHSHSMNQLVHIICVPLLLFTVFIFAAYVPPPIKVVPQLTWPLLGAGAWSLHHVRTAPLVGSLVSCLTFAMALAATAIVKRETRASKHAGRAARCAGLVHVVCWYAQLHPGHGVYEGRKPALLDSVLQAFLDAPLFVWYEVAFACGYDPSLKAQLDAAVTARHAAWSRSEL